MYTGEAEGASSWIPDLLNNLYLMGGLLAAIFVIMWRLNSASQKAIQYSVDSLQVSLTKVEGGVSNLQTEMAGVKDRLTKVEGGVSNLQAEMIGVKDRLGKVEQSVVVVDDRVRNLQTEMAVVKDRIGKVEQSVVVVDDRVRNLQTEMAVVKDRLHILTDTEPASLAAVRAGSSVQQVAAAEA